VGFVAPAVGAEVGLEDGNGVIMIDGEPEGVSVAVGRGIWLPEGVGVTVPEVV
jgi:hypothetical protein